MPTATKKQAETMKRHSLVWQKENLMIIDKKTQLIPLRHNSAQKKVYQSVALQRKYNYPVRLIVLKARQEGISTYMEAEIFEGINSKPNVHGCIASADKDSTEKVFRMCDTFQEQMPEDERRQTVRASAKEIRYAAPHRSSILCQTAGKRMLGRGGTTQLVHATEVAFWANAKRQLLGLRNEVPDEPDTLICLESTANGIGGAFHDEYYAALKRMRNYSRSDGKKDPSALRGYLPIFLDWQSFPEYQTPLPKGCSDVPNMTTDMQEYVREGLSMGVSLTPEQIYFALIKVQTNCSGDISLFKQEYPRTAREAFQSTGRMVFRPYDIDTMEQNCKVPVATVEFYKEDDKIKVRHVTKRENCWSIWKWPVKSHSYVGFCDVAEGVLSDPKDERSAPDRSVAGIMDRNWHDVPATYYGRPETTDFGEQFLLGCSFFNYAWASPEMNSIGMSILDTMKKADYPFIYAREKKEEEIVREDSQKYGWKTTTLTRKSMIADLSKVIREQNLTVFDIRFIEELRVFTWNPQGKPQALVGEHDDCVITLAGLIQMHLRCPYNEDLGFADEKPKAKPAIAVMGEMDFDEDDMEDELDLLYEDMSEFE